MKIRRRNSNRLAARHRLLLEMEACDAALRKIGLVVTQERIDTWTHRDRKAVTKWATAILDAALIQGDAPRLARPPCLGPVEFNPEVAG